MKGKDVDAWLRGQESYTLHKPIRYKFQRRRTIVAGPDQQLQADLLDVSKYAGENEGVKYLLTAVDVFSKFAWAVPLKSKKTTAVLKAFGRLLDTTKPRKPQSVQTDKGGEFVSDAFRRYLRKKRILHFTSENDDIKCSVVERFNRTLQTKIHRFFTRHHTRRYLTALPKLIDAYNRRKQRASL